ncbi:MAG: hypothetical protein EOO77_22845, partial [Oxalobacteraceae bacterium]
MSVVNMIRPMVNQFIHRKKIRRGELFPVMRSAFEQIELVPSVIRADFRALMRSRLSSNEEYQIAYLQTAQYEGDARAAEIMFGRIRMNRRALRMSMGSTRFIVSQHVLARYMRRYQKGPETFFANVVPAIQMAYALGPAVVALERNEIALPMGDGLLLGFVYYSKVPASQEIAEMSYELDEHGTTEPETCYRPGPRKGAALQFEIMTYLDEGDLKESGVKETLRNRLRTFQTEHHEGIAGVFDAIILAQGST